MIRIIQADQDMLRRDERHNRIMNNLQIVAVAVLLWGILGIIVYFTLKGL